MAEPEVGLAEAIRSLRQELMLALAEGEDEFVRFHLGPVELEFNVAVTVGGKAGAGVKFWVLSADASGSLSRASQHRIKLTLQPIGPTGEDLQVASDEEERPQ